MPTTPLPPELVAWWLLKGSAILLVALVLSRLLAGRPAALRHAVWAVAVGAHLLLPFGERLVPAGAPGSAALAVPLPADPPALVAALALVEGPAAAPAGGASAASVSPAEPGSAAASRAPWRSAWPWLLAGGSALLLLRLALGTARIVVIARGSRRVTEGDWLSLLQTQCRALGIRRPVTLVWSDRVQLPVTWGVVYPTVLLPAAAAGWPAETRRHVLLHELAHVRRCDALTQLLGQLALALFWFQPLLWAAVRRMRAEAENACDDHVLRGGERPSVYASTLLALVRAYAGRTAPAFASLSVVRKSELETRVAALVHPRRDASARGALLALVAGVTALLVLPLSAARVAARESFEGSATHAAGGARAAAGEGSAEDGLACRPLVVPDFPASQTSGTLTTDDGITRHYFFLRPAADRCVEASFPLDTRFTADDRDLVPTPGLEALLREVLPGVERAVWLREEEGRIARRYLRDGRPAAWDADAAAWYARIVPEFIGRTGAGAADRARRIVEEGGVEGLVAELATLEDLDVRKSYLVALLSLRDADELPRAEFVALAREALAAYPPLVAGFLAELAAREAGRGDVRATVLAATAELRDPADRGTVLAALLRHHDRAVRRAALAAAGELLPAGSYLRPFLLEAQPFALAADPALHDAYFAAAARLSHPLERRELLGELLARDLPEPARSRVAAEARALPDPRLRAELEREIVSRGID